MNDLTMNLVLAAVVIIPGVILLAYYFSVVKSKKPGWYHKKIHGILVRYGVIRNYKILQDVNLEINGKKAHFDHMLIGFFGILVVTPLDRRGSYYGEARSQTWAFDDGKFKNPMPNLAAEYENSTALLRSLFSQHGIYKIGMEQVFVLEANEKKSASYLGGDITVLRINKLGSYLEKTKFDQDKDVDVETITKLISENACRT